MMAVDMSDLGSVMPVVRSVDWDNESNRVVVGTLGAEVFVLSGGDGSNTRVGGGPFIQVCDMRPICVRGDVSVCVLGSLTRWSGGAWVERSSNDESIRHCR